MTTNPGLLKTKTSKRVASPESNQGFAMGSDEMSLRTDELSEEEKKGPLSRQEGGSFSLA